MHHSCYLIIVLIYRDLLEIQHSQIYFCKSNSGSEKIWRLILKNQTNSLVRRLDFLMRKLILPISTEMASNSKYCAPLNVLEERFL